MLRRNVVESSGMTDEIAKEESERTPVRPAYILYRSNESEFRIAGLTLLDRQLVTLHRGGCQSITIITSDSVPAPTRAQSLGIPIRIASSLPNTQQECLVVDGNVFLELKDVERLWESTTELASKSGTRLGALRLTSPDEWSDRWAAPGNPSPTTTRARLVTSPEEATSLSQNLLKGTSSSADGLVDRFLNRPLSRLVTRRLLESGTSPNLVSVISIFIGLAAGFLLAIPRQEFSVLGALLFQLSAIIDCCDGDVARLQFKESQLGKWLDIVGDQIVHIAVFIGIGAGLIRATSSFAITMLTGSAVIGAVLAFATVLWATKRAESDPRIHRFLQATANRDFSIIVLILACIGRLDIFAWLVGIGIHVYWIGLLALSLRSQPQAPKP